jgi:dienelactone hydrolase
VDRTAAREARRRADANRRRTRRRRVLGAALAALIALAVTLAVALPGHGDRSRSGASASSVPSTPSGSQAPGSPPAPQPQGSPPHAPYAVGVRVLRLVDQSRTVELPSGRSPRTLMTIVRYPALGTASTRDLAGAPAARAAGPFPLVVFGHGFAVTPGLYAALLHTWAQAGYVVAAPVFPLEQANAPGGPDESDLVNQPQDMRFVISRMLAASATSGTALGGLVDARRIAVAGQSDGGETALAVAYDTPFRDPRVRAAVILSGAKIPGIGFAFPAHGSPPLLATQGNLDTVNPPSFTHAFYDSAPRPKYLLDLPGASHLPPYSTQQPQLGIVERVTIAFFRAYLGGAGGGAAQRIAALGNVPGVATLSAQP